MKFLRRLLHALLGVAVYWFAPSADAGNCSFTSLSLAPPAYAGTADPAAGTANWLCTRVSNSTDGPSITFNTSATPSGNLSNGVSTLPYSLSGTSQTITVNFPTGVNSMSGAFSFNFSIAAGLNPSAGTTYTDSVPFGGTCTASKTKGTCSVTPATLSVSVDVTPKCAVSSPLKDMNFTYISFQTTPAVDNSPYTVYCTNNTPYTMAVDVSPTNNTILGIPYSLKLGTTPNATNDVSGTSYTGTGAGIGVTYYINGSINPGLAGTCSSNCSATETHTLTISY
jgi:hypothetical protein